MAREFDSDQKQVSTATESPDPTPREEERRVGTSMLAKVALAVGVLSALVISIALVMQTNQLRKQTEELEEQVDAYNEDLKRLIYDINREADDQYIIDQARRLWDRYFPDEEIYYNDVND